MSNLPPYSTYRTDSKQMMFPQATSHGNILTFTPPGFKHSLNVKFPDSRLPVCEKCKKNFKTRDMCRVRNAHTTSPWTTAYICITLDESCTDADNNAYIDKPLTVRMVQWQPYCVKTPFDPKTPVCASCKKTNRTRSFCRERHKHRQLPWCTVYVLLSALDRADPNTVVAAPSQLIKSEGDGAPGAPASTPTKPPAVSTAPNGDGETTPTVKTEGTVSHEEAVAAAQGSSLGPQGTPAAAASFDSAHTTEPPTSDESERKKGVDDEGDDINQIAESRTFLAKVSGKSTTIHWLDLAEYDSNDASTFDGYPSGSSTPMAAAMAPPGAPMPPMDPGQAQYYYTAQQHQHALKSHQQYYFQMHQQRTQQQQPYMWQGHHYPGQPIPVAAAPGHPPPPPPPPQQHEHQPQPGHPPPGTAPAPPPPLQAQPPQASTPGAASEGAASPAPVTAGEAAAQQRRNRQAAQSVSAEHPTPGSQEHQQHHYQHPQHHPHHMPAPQQQQWAMYQPQVYAPQPVAPAQHHAPPPPGGPPPPQHGQHGHPPPSHYPPHPTAPAPTMHGGPPPPAGVPAETGVPAEHHHYAAHPPPPQQHHQQPPPQHHHHQQPPAQPQQQTEHLQQPESAGQEPESVPLTAGESAAKRRRTEG